MVRLYPVWYDAHGVKVSKGSRLRGHEVEGMVSIADRKGGQREATRFADARERVTVVQQTGTSGSEV